MYMYIPPEMEANAENVKMYILLWGNKNTRNGYFTKTNKQKANERIIGLFISTVWDILVQWSSDLKCAI